MRATKAPKLLHKPATHSDDEDVKTPGLVKRGNRWQFRRRIPEELRRYFDKKREFLKSLGDVSLKDAKRLAAREWAMTDDLLADAERRYANRVSLDKLSMSEIATVARLYLADHEKAAELLSDNFSKKDIKERKEANNDDLFALNYGPTDSGVQQAALRVAKDVGIEAALGDKNFFALAEAVHAAMLEHHKRMDDRLRDRPLCVYDQRFSEANMRKAFGPSLDQIVDRWANKDVPPTAKTVEKARKVVADFTANIGKLPVTAITSDHVLRFVDHLLNSDSSTATAKNKLNIFRAIVRFAKKMKVIDSDPCDDISISVKRRRSDERRGYTLEELKLVFGSDIYTKGHRPIGGQGQTAYWLPLMALFSGARLEELGQLRLKDIQEEPYLDAAGIHQKAWIIRMSVVRTFGTTRGVD